MNATVLTRVVQRRTGNFIQCERANLTIALTAARHLHQCNSTWSLTIGHLQPNGAGSLLGRLNFGHLAIAPSVLVVVIGRCMSLECTLEVRLASVNGVQTIATLRGSLMHGRLLGVVEVNHLVDMGGGIGCWCGGSIFAQTAAGHAAGQGALTKCAISQHGHPTHRLFELRIPALDSAQRDEGHTTHYQNNRSSNGDHGSLAFGGNVEGIVWTVGHAEIRRRHS